MLGIVVIIYSQTYSFDYVLDDKIVFTENSFVQKGWNGIGEILFTESFSGYFGGQQDILPGARYRPLSIITFAIENQLWGTDSRWSHLINVILYFICSLIVLQAISLLIKDQFPENKEWIAGLAALIFLTHPIHVEAVANVKGRDEIMVLIFSLLSLIYTFKFLRQSKIYAIVISAVSFLLALLSKENALTFLAVIPLSVFLFSKPSIKKWIIVILAIGVPSLIYFILRYQAVGYILGPASPTGIMNNPFVYMNGHQKFATIAHTLLLYLKLSIFPHPLTHDYYPYHIPIKHWNQITPILSVLVHLILLLFAFVRRKKNPIITWCIFTYALTMSIVSNVFVGVGTFMNERFLFVSSITTCLLLSIIFWHFFNGKNKFSKYSAIALMSLIIIGYTLKSIQRVPAWENGFTLNSAAVKVSKNSARANLFMGTNYFNQYQNAQGASQKQEILTLADQFISKSYDILPQYRNAAKMKVGVAAEKFKYDNDIVTLLGTFFQVGKRSPEIGFLHEYLKYLNDIPSYSTELIRFYYDLGYTEMFKNQKRNEWSARFLLYAAGINENDVQINLALSEVYNALNRPQETQYYLQKARNEGL